MANISLLWYNRKKYTFFSYLFFKTWLKRLFLFPQLLKFYFRRLRLQCSGAKIHDSAEIGLAVFKGKLCNLFVGESSFIGRAHIALHGNVIIGSRVVINDGVKILTASHNVLSTSWDQFSKDIRIDDYAWIATDAIILPGVTIGKGAVVGAGAVVFESVKAFSIVVGNPAKEINKKRETSLDYNPCEFLAFYSAWI
jgi:acetyltransferase-like isoleucine patch superfamily enzyme